MIVLDVLLRFRYVIPDGRSLKAPVIVLEVLVRYRYVIDRGIDARVKDKHAPAVVIVNLVNAL